MSLQIYEYGRSFHLLFSSVSFFSVLQCFHCRGLLYPCLGLFQGYFCFALFACSCFRLLLWQYQKKLVEERAFLVCSSDSPSWREVGSGIQTMEDTAYWLTQPGFLHHLGPLAEGWTFPHQLLIKKMLHSLIYSQCIRGIFSVEVSPF